MKQIIMTSLVLILSGMAFANHEAGHEGKESQKPEAQAVNLACKEESAKAMCGDEKVGTGLIKCIRKYKKEHKKEFTISDGCKEAMKSLKSARNKKH